MRAALLKTISNPLFSSSFIMVAGTNSINVINYIYHVVMGRLLGPAEYGELAAFFSLIGLLSVIPLSFGTVIIKFVASSKDDHQVAAYLKWFTKPVLLIALLLALGTALSSNYLATYLNTPHSTGILIIAFSFLFGLPSYLYRSVLQGLIKFNLVVISLISETGMKLVAGAVFVFLGFGVMGAMTGLLFSVITGWIVSFVFLKKYRKIETQGEVHTKSIFAFTLPVLVQTAAMTSIMSVDLVLVKHFFSSFDAGIYAAVATLGKIILFASAPVATVMFPLVTRRFAKKENYVGMFLLSIGLTVLVVVGVIFLYYLFPYFVMSLLYGDKYFSGVDLLVPYAIYTGLISLSGLFINLFLSVNHNKIVILPLFGAVLQLIGINLFHQTISQVVWVSIAVAALLFISLSVYFLASGLLNGYKIDKK